jgi:hypothetical protein
MEARKFDYLQADAAPVTQPGSQIMKRAIFNVGLQQRLPFKLHGLEMAFLITPSTPSGIVSGPWKTAVQILYSSAHTVYPFLPVGATNPLIWAGRVTLADNLGGDGATFVAQGSVRFRAPIFIKDPGWGITVNYRPGTEWGQSDVQLVIEQV